ncbi:hypothetical protein CJ030_MR2G000491 [Morella rubra]|uniref:Uncharacterized protein n=1 Tax=Morella rubra TaxID=262757 RepID=A0A6A1WF66_9ROSI|nr:hypothetical protein CJ030_MR2G000491 [Morella rubra]
MIPLTRNDVEAYVPVTDENGPQQREVEGRDDSSESFSEDCSDLKNMTPRTKRRSVINKENRAKLKIVHTSGARSFQRARALLEKMEALQLQHELEGKSYTEVEIFAEVLGTKAGFVQGLGRSVRSVGSSSSAASVDLSRRLEEARLEIEEMRARQMEYEALLVKRSDMKQTMQEHLQMIEEQQRKKNEELMQMMRCR